MSEKSSRRVGSFRDLIYFPVAYNAVGLVLLAALYVASPGHSPGAETLNVVLYTGVLITHWTLAYIVARRIGAEGVRELIRPKKRVNWLAAALVFAALNALFTSYIVLGLRTGRIPLMVGPSIPQAIFYLVVNPLTAGVVEELVWRGYLIEGLLASGRTEPKAFLLSSISFAFIHGFFLVDKIVVTTLFGIIAGLYYVRERNLPVLMATHVALDVIAFSLPFYFRA
jgi:membrane protease YdiL (CAAX protease family)